MVDSPRVLRCFSQDRASPGGRGGPNGQDRPQGGVHNPFLHITSPLSLLHHGKHNPTPPPTPQLVVAWFGLIWARLYNPSPRPPALASPVSLTRSVTVVLSAEAAVSMVTVPLRVYLNALASIVCTWYVHGWAGACGRM